MPPYVKERSFSTAPEGIDFSSREMYNDKKDAGMAELADAQDFALVTSVEGFSPLQYFNFRYCIIRTEVNEDVQKR